MDNDIVREPEQPTAGPEVGETSEGTPRRHTRRWVLGGLGAVLVTGVVVAYPYRRQIRSYLTHWKGGPDETVPLTTLPPGTPRLLHVAVAGDTGDSGSRLDATADAIAEWGTVDPYQVLLLLGDNVYPNGDPERLQETVFEPFAATLASGAELLAILGNHDVKDDHGAAQMEALGMDGRWWMRQYGDVMIVGLDSTIAEDPDQVAWVENILANSTARWRVVAVHHPPYSAGYQGSNLKVREIYQPIFERHGVQLVLSGHDHDYQRSEPINGVIYVVSGAGSGTRRTGEASFTAVSYSFHHFLDMNVFADHIVVRAVSQSLGVADEFTVPAAGA